jgi:hypothetical protein
MLASTKQETCRCEDLLCEIYDLRNQMVGFAYGTIGILPQATRMPKSLLVARPQEYWTN